MDKVSDRKDFDMKTKYYVVLSYLAILLITFAFTREYRIVFIVAGVISILFGTFLLVNNKLRISQVLHDEYSSQGISIPLLLYISGIIAVFVTLV